MNNFLIEQYANGRKVLLIIDEAQNLSNKVLEEVRLLSGVETTKEKVLRIILAGQPELNDKLDSAELVQLRQRVRLRFHLTALSEPDTEAYVRHRLRIAGAGDREIFEPETFPVIFRYTGGIPRLVNTLCDTALIAAFAQDRPTVSAEDVQSAVTELQWVEYAARTSSQLQHAQDETASQEQPPVGRLVVTLKGSKVQESYLVPGRLVIGRTADNDLQIESKYVSRHHAQVVTTAEGSCARGPEQHQRRVRARPARAAPQAAGRRRREARHARDHLPPCGTAWRRDHDPAARRGRVGRRGRRRRGARGRPRGLSAQSSSELESYSDWFSRYSRRRIHSTRPAVRASAADQHEQPVRRPLADECGRERGRAEHHVRVRQRFVQSAWNPHGPGRPRSLRPCRPR